MGMLDLTDKQFAKAQRIYTSSTKWRAAGYRVMVRAIEQVDVLTGIEAENAPTLAEKGFITKTSDQLERENRGGDGGVVVDIGPAAFKGPHLVDREPWVELGQVIKYARYSGKLEEIPHNSKKWYRVINDEDVLEYNEEKV